MKITPLDIRQKRFQSSFRGFSARDVEGYLELLAGEFEEVVKENITLKETLKRLQMELEHHKERERTLQETMVTAQRISEDLRQAAKKEADIILGDAELQAEKIVHNAQQKLVQVVDDINELKRQRVQFESQVRSIIDAHQKLLETFSSDRDVHGEDNLAFLQRKAHGD
jgi:cell division initiation protein